MLLNNKKTRATMKLVWEYVHMCSSLSEIDMLSNTQNLPANQTDYKTLPKALRTQALTTLTSNFGLVW